MNTPPIPSAESIRWRIHEMNYAQLQRLASLSGVSFYTLLKIRDGETTNPGIETVRAFAPYITEALGDGYPPRRIRSKAAA